MVAGLTAPSMLSGVLHLDPSAAEEEYPDDEEGVAAAAAPPGMSK